MLRFALTGLIFSLCSGCTLIQPRREASTIEEMASERAEVTLFGAEPMPQLSKDARIYTGRPSAKSVEIGAIVITAKTPEEGFHVLSLMLRSTAARHGATAVFDFKQEEIPVEIKRKRGMTISMGRNPPPVAPADSSISYIKRVSGIAVFVTEAP